MYLHIGSGTGATPIGHQEKTVNAEQQQELKWIAQAKRDPEAFEHLFKKYYQPIYNYVLRRLYNQTAAKDVTANTFVKALENLNKFQWRGVLFSSWLYRIATNEVNQYFRKNKRVVALSDEHEATLKSDITSDAEVINSESEMAKNIRSKQLHLALSTLKAKYQTVITLRYFEELSLKQISEILDLPENTVKTHIRRGLEQLKKAL